GRRLGPGGRARGADRGGEPVRCRRAVRNRLLRAEGALPAPWDWPGPEHRLGESDQIGVEVTRLAGSGGQVPGVDRQLAGAHRDQHRSRCFAERRWEGLVEYTLAVEGCAQLAD